MFGQWVEVNGNTIMVEEEKEAEVICTQIDLVDGRSLTERGKCIAKRCSLWNVYGVTDEVFCCCIRSAVGTGMEATKMKCVQFRYGSQRNCRHETGCIKVLTDAGLVIVNDICEIREALGQDPIIDATKNDSDSSSEYSHSELELDDDDDGGVQYAESLREEGDGRRPSMVHGRIVTRGRSTL